MSEPTSPTPSALSSWLRSRPRGVAVAAALVLAVAVGAAAAVAGGGSDDPVDSLTQATQQPTEEATPTPEPTEEPTPTPTPSPSASPTPKPMPTATPSRTVVPTTRAPVVTTAPPVTTRAPTPAPSPKLTEDALVTVSNFSGRDVELAVNSAEVTVRNGTTEDLAFDIVGAEHDAYSLRLSRYPTCGVGDLGDFGLRPGKHYELSIVPTPGNDCTPEGADPVQSVRLKLPAGSLAWPAYTAPSYPGSARVTVVNQATEEVRLVVNEKGFTFPKGTSRTVTVPVRGDNNDITFLGSVKNSECGGTDAGGYGLADGGAYRIVIQDTKPANCYLNGFDKPAVSNPQFGTVGEPWPEA